MNFFCPICRVNLCDICKISHIHINCVPLPKKIIKNSNNNVTLNKKENEITKQLKIISHSLNN